MTIPNSSFYMKYDAVEMNGNRIITTFDEYFDVIRRYVAANPTTGGAPTIGFSGPAEDWRFVFTVQGARKLAGWHNTGRFLHDPSKDYLGTAANTMEFHRDYFLFMRELQEEGLLDPEFFSQTHVEYEAKIAAGRIVGTHDESWQIMTPQSLIISEGRQADLLVPFAIYNDDRVTGMECAYAGLVALPTTTDICISVQAKNPELILQFYDFLATDVMQELLWWGIEGEHYQRDAKGRRFLTEAQYEERQANPLFGDETGIQHGGIAVPTRLDRGVEWPDGSGVTDPGRDRLIRTPFLYSEIEKNVLKALGIDNFWDLVGKPYVSPYGIGWDVAPTEAQPDLLDIHNYLDHAGGHGEYGQFFFQHMVMAKSEREAIAIWDEMQQWLIDNGVHVMEEYFTERVRDRVRTWN
jgi:putative aldouronate transport system substrate-binding protein